MTTPQPGIFSDQYSDHMILEFNVRLIAAPKSGLGRCRALVRRCPRVALPYWHSVLPAGQNWHRPRCQII